MPLFPQIRLKDSYCFADLFQPHHPAFVEDHVSDKPE